MEIITQNDLYKLYDEVNKYGYFYHDLDSPLVPDEIYDALIHKIEIIESEHPEWKRDDSPSNHVSGKASKRELKKILHEEPLLSLEDKFSYAEVEEWYKNSGFNSKKMGQPAFDIEMKVDGLSVALEYIDGLFVRASTRGDGRVGEDVTENIKQVKGIPFDINKKLLKLDSSFSNHSVLRVRVEVVMLNNEFERINKDRELNGEPLYANPRNAAAGTLRVINPDLVRERRLEAIAFSILYAGGFDNLSYEIKPGYSQINDIRFLDMLGFHTVDFMECTTIEDIISAINSVENTRMQLPYWIDGAVIKVNNIDIQREMGTTSKYPRWAIAYKYVPEEKTTRVKNIIVQTGRTGILTPKVEFEPVNLGGTKVQFATLHNPGQIKALGGIAVGDEIDVNKAAEIIPQVVRVHVNKRLSESKLFEIESCPSCGSKAKIITKDGVEIAYCVNEYCPAKKQKYFEFVVGRNILNIVGLGPSIIFLLIDSGLLNTLADVYRLKNHRHTLRLLPGLGEISADKLLSSIETSKQQPLNRIFASLGIKGCGTHIGAILEENYADIWEISKSTEKELISLNGIGHTLAKEIVNYFSNRENLQVLSDLESLGVNMKSTHRETNFNLPLLKLSFVITGSLESMTRKEAEQLIKDNGGRVSSSVSGNTNYLLAGRAPGSKLKKALELGISVIGEDDLNRMINA